MKGEDSQLRRLAIRLALKVCLWLNKLAPDKPAQTSDGNVRRILVVELWNIGDVVLTLPFLAQLRAIFPGAHCSLLCLPHARSVLEGSGLIDSFIETKLTWRDTDKAFRPLAYDWREFARVIRKVRAEHFDLVFQAKRHVREHFLLASSGIPRRVGYRQDHGVNGVLTDEIAGHEGRQKSAEWIDLLAPFGGPRVLPESRLHVSALEREWAREYLELRGIGANDVIVGIHPGASVPEKRWPLERFAEVVRRTALGHSYRLLVFVDPVGYGASLADLPGAVTAQVGLRELIALISRCTVLLCNDSGPMHLAGALGVPTVAIFAAGIDRAFTPLGHGHRLVIADSAAGVSAVPVSAVADALGSALSEVAGVRRGG